MSERITNVSVESIATAVTGVVSDIESCGLLELPPLYNAIDVEALEAFCAHASPASHDEGPEGSISFTYSESLVSVDRGESITVDAVPATDEAVSDVTEASVEGESTSPSH